MAVGVVSASVAHPVLECADRIASAVGEVADVQPVFMTTAAKQTALVELAAVEARVAELRLRVLAASDEVGEDAGARDSAAWVSSATRTDPRAAAADRHLAKALEAHPRVAAGMREGRVSVAQARTVVAGLAAIPASVGASVVHDAEATLVGYCDTFGPVELRRLARRILDVVAPGVAEAEEAERLEAEERRAAETASIKSKDQGDGTSRFWGVLPTAAWKRLEHYLQAISAPRVRVAREAGERLVRHRAYAEAFIALLELLDPDRLPEHGGDATTVMVTITLDQLLTELATAGMTAGHTGEGEFISAEEARRLACQASIIPVVLGGKGEVLDLGRSRRLFSRAQRKALRLRDKECRAEGCTMPAAWCEAHHLTPWSRGGRTDLADGVLLCSRHHHLIHDRTHGHTRLPSGDYRFHRRT